MGLDVDGARVGSCVGGGSSRNAFRDGANIPSKVQGATGALIPCGLNGKLFSFAPDATTHRCPGSDLLETHCHKQHMHTTPTTSYVGHAHGGAQSPLTGVRPSSAQLWHLAGLIQPISISLYILVTATACTFPGGTGMSRHSLQFIEPPSHSSVGPGDACHPSCIASLKGSIEHGQLIARPFEVRKVSHRVMKIRKKENNSEGLP